MTALTVNDLDLAVLEKWNALEDRLRALESVVVAFSGGVDSSLLAVAAHRVLAPHMLAVTIHSEVETQGIMEMAASIASRFGFPHQIIQYDKLQDEDYVENSPNRCYVCKSVDLGMITEIARKANIRHVLMGANADDLGDYRPGLRAAGELGVLSPLAEVGLTKKEIRQLSRAFDLPNWNHPSSPCLASRIPYGTKVTRQKLEQIAAGEGYLRALNFNVVRVRNTGPTVRIEVAPSELSRLIDLREMVISFFKQLGFQYVTLDLEGYRTGSLNEILPAASKKT